ncbi:MAG: DEAD/DEAH box helicase, partial [Chloroflexi bacterium]
IDQQIVEQTEESLKTLNAESTDFGYRVAVTEFDSLEEFIAAIGGEERLSEEYKQFRDQLTGFEPNHDFRLTDTIEIDLKNTSINLRPYQRGGIHWLDWLRRSYLHGVLADDMGLGKTLQAVCTLRMGYEHTGNNQPSLIVCPRSVITHWDRELRRFFPQSRPYRYHGSQRELSVFYSTVPYIGITTYETLTNDIEHLSRLNFFYVILDEATYIKNPNAKRTQAIKKLNATHRLALSGTPVENSPSELWSIFDFLLPGHLGKYYTFKRVFEDKIASRESSATVRLGRKIRPFILRRLKEDVAKDLPKKIEIDEWCSLTEEQKQIYGAIQGRYKHVGEALRRGENVNILPLLTKLKQTCDHPRIITKDARPLHNRSNKFDWVVDKIEEIANLEQQVVVFTHFLDMLSLLESALVERKISFIRIDGSTTNRQELIDDFNSGQSTSALCSIKAVAHGINLTSANHVIHADRWWNPAVEDQATDRVHRIGQEQTVYVYRILTEGTLEERIDRLLESKRDLADQIIGATVKGTRKWTRAELLEILRPLDEFEDDSY